MTFAVGLREDAANAEYYVKKILPMSFYEPGKPVEKRARAPPKDAPPVEALDVPELVEMRQRLRDVLRGCEKMEREEKQCAAELQAATDRLATVEKRSAQLDDQLDQYDEQLAEERNRTLAASMDAEQTRAQHAELLEQVERGERAVARLEAELAEEEAQLRALEACSDLELVFGATTSRRRGSSCATASRAYARRQPPAKPRSGTSYGGPSRPRGVGGATTLPDTSFKRRSAPAAALRRRGGRPVVRRKRAGYPSKERMPSEGALTAAAIFDAPVGHPREDPFCKTRSTEPHFKSSYHYFVTQLERKSLMAAHL